MLRKMKDLLVFCCCFRQNLNSAVSGIRGKIFPLKEKPPLTLSTSVSCKDLRSLSDVKDDREISDESQPVAADGNCNTKCADAETENLEASSSEASENPPPQGRRFFGLLKQRSFRRQSTVKPVSVPTLSRKFSSVKERSIPSPSHGPTDPEFLCLMKPSWKNFSLAELRAATNNFSSKNIIGKGGYAEVYKGQLQDGRFVAIKRLTRGTMEEMTQDFLSELGIIVHVNHPNAAKLIGFGVEEGMTLVLQLSAHGCLAELLTGAKEKLDWNTRYKIALGTAEGLYYLHERCPRRIIHRDIKAANILLTDDFEPQICDFGLAKWLPDQWTHHTVSKFEGTFGYLAPEYLLHGTFDEKTDIYAFGVVLLELITGRPAIDSSQKSLVMWAQPLLESCEIMQLVDPSLCGAFNPQEMNSVMVAASACIRQSSLSRPPMKQVIELLRGVCDFNSITSSGTSGWQRGCSEETTAAGESISTRYSNDLTQRTQVAPES